MSRPKPVPRQPAHRPSENVYVPGETASIGDLLRSKRQPTPDESKAIADVHALVSEWSAGKLPVWEIAKLTTGRQRFLATRFTPPEHPMFRPLMAALDELIAGTGPEPVYRTNHGLVSEGDLRDAAAKVERDGGDELVVFPIRWPWRIKPDRSRGEPGVRGDPVYRPKDQRRPEVGEFSAVPRQATFSEDDVDERNDTPWWDRD